MNMLKKNVSMGLSITVVGLGILVALFWNELPLQIIWPYIVQSPIDIDGEVQTVQFVGSAAGEHTYFIYLPEGYHSGEQRYRTLYHLHGRHFRESWAAYDCTNIGHHLEAAVTAGLVEPMIVVCPFDPNGDSMWVDSYDKQILTWTALTQDIIPHIDATYRTIPQSSARVMQGFSMGGFGAAMNAFRAPELFGTLVIWDGALHDWNTITNNREEIATKMFQTESYFNQWSPWELTTHSDDTDIDMFMVVGEMESVRDYGERFQIHLNNVGQEFTAVEASCPHSLICMMDDHGEEAFAFIAKSFVQQDRSE
ncbi:MAG: alpha/beta hydrolase-fold protein [Chloroflexota bacterium]